MNVSADPRCGCVDGYMNRKEATTVVRQELMKYRRMPYVELRRLVDTRLPTLVIKGASGAEYQVVIQVHWEGKRGGDTGPRKTCG